MTKKLKCGGKHFNRFNAELMNNAIISNNNRTRVMKYASYFTEL